MSSRTVASAKLPADLQAAAEHLQQGRAAVAARLAQKRLREYPNDGAARYLLGTLALQAGNFIEARAHFKQAIACTDRQPALATCWNALGHALLGMNKLQRAQVAFRRALRIKPATLKFAIDFAQALIADGQLLSAAKVLTGIVEHPPPDPKMLTLLGDLMMQCNRFDDALNLYALVTQQDPGCTLALVHASTALLILGQTAKAQASCSHALKLAPNLTAYYQLATLGGLEMDTQHLATAKQHAVAMGSVPVAARIDACFALAHVYDRKGNYDLAYSYLEKGNQLKRGTLDFHMGDEAQRVGALIEFFNAEFIERFTGRVESDLRPIFIVGMPRSGSTLLEQMLAAHPCITACGELDYMTEAARSFGAHRRTYAPTPRADEQMISDLRRTASRYARSIRGQMSGPECFTDKMPANFLFLGLIHLIFPRASIIQVLRNPMDTCLSCYQHLFPGHAPFAYDLRELGQYCGLYENLMQHWRNALPAGSFLTVEYESLVDDPETHIKRVLEYCGLRFDAHCLNPAAVQRPVITLSASQVRRPIYRSSVNHWQHYAEHLAPLEQALQSPL